MEFCNRKVYEQAASKTGQKYSDVEAVWDSVGATIESVIIQNNPDISVKLDGLGNFVSYGYRREKVMQSKS